MLQFRPVSHSFNGAAALPKAELHLHLEGSVWPATLRLLAERAHHPWATWSAARLAGLYRYRHFEDFLRLYKQVCSLLRTPEDYALVTRRLAQQLRRQGITYAEVYVSPLVFVRAGLAYPDVLEALDEAAVEIEARGGPRLLWLLDSVRHWGPQAASRVLALARQYPSRRVVGFGIGGDETAHRARDFAPAYRAARRLGLGTVIHAGEWCGAESVAAALDALPLDRIAHGVRAVDSPALLERLRRLDIALDVAISSNLATGAVGSLATHPLLRLLDAGIAVSLSTDDPPMFATTLGREYRLARRLLAGREDRIETLRLTAFRRAFSPRR